MEWVVLAAAVAATIQAIAASASVTPFMLGAGGVIAGLAIAGAIAAAKNAISVDDFKSGPGGITHMMGPAGTFSLNPRDSVLATTNPIPVNDVATGAAGSMGAGLSEADASRIGKAMASNMRFETTVTNRQQQIIIDGALNPLGGRPITA